MISEDEKSMKKQIAQSNDIIFRSHAYERLSNYSIDECEIKELIWNTELLIQVIPQTDSIGEKYRLVYHKSNKYDFIAVIKFENNNIYIITFYIQNKKRLKSLKIWKNHHNR